MTKYIISSISASMDGAPFCDIIRTAIAYEKENSNSFKTFNLNSFGDRISASVSVDGGRTWSAAISVSSSKGPLKKWGKGDDIILE